MSAPTVLMLPAVLAPAEIQQVLALLGRTQLQGNEALAFVSLAQKLTHLADLTTKALEAQGAREAVEAAGPAPADTAPAIPAAAIAPPATPQPGQRPRAARRR